MKKGFGLAALLLASYLFGGLMFHLASPHGLWVFLAVGGVFGFYGFVGWYIVVEDMRAKKILSEAKKSVSEDKKIHDKV